MSPFPSRRRWRPAEPEQTRSLSRYGLSQVTVVFRDGTNIYSRGNWSMSASKRPGQAARWTHTHARAHRHRPRRIYLWTVEPRTVR